MNNSNILDSKDLPEALREDSAIVKAVHDLNVMGLEPEEQDIYDKEVLANMVDAGVLQYEREEGRQEGRQEGWQASKVDTLSMLLQHRFSTMPDHVTKGLDKLSTDQLNDLLKSMLDFTSLSDLENWLAERRTDTQAGH